MTTRLAIGRNPALHIQMTRLIETDKTSLRTFTLLEESVHVGENKYCYFIGCFCVYLLILPDVLDISSSQQQQTHFQEIRPNKRLVSSSQAALWGTSRLFCCFSHQINEIALLVWSLESMVVSLCSDQSHDHRYKHKQWRTCKDLTTHDTTSKTPRSR